MIHILVHDKKDTVGVAVTEGIKSGQELTGWVMEDDSTITVKALNDVPIGHKVATTEIKKGDTVITIQGQTSGTVCEVSDFDILTCGQLQDLVDLGRMPMPADGVSG